MEYMLVLQWPASSIDDYDDLIAVEDMLLEGLDDAEVDGHDAGAGEVNIFIRTDDPASTFGAVKAILNGTPRWKDIRAAHRRATGSAYTILWPPGWTKFSVA
jgi:hypothetical protein